MERDVEPLEVPEHPAPQLEQHLLADPAGPPQEEHPAGRLDQHHAAQRRRRSTISVCAEPPARIGGMPWSMPRCTSSGTESRATFSTTTTSASSATVSAVGPQQRAQQRARLAAARHALVDRQLVVLAVVDAAAPVVLGDVDWLVSVAVIGPRPPMWRTRSSASPRLRSASRSSCAWPAAALLVVLPRAAALGAVVEFVVGGQQVAVLRHVGQQLGVRADVGDRAVLAAAPPGRRAAPSTRGAPPRCRSPSCSTRRSASSTTASVCTSSADSVSSSTRIFGAARMARASDSRCRWPPDRLMPCSPMRVSSPNGRS